MDTFWTPTNIMIVTFSVVIGFGAVFCLVAFKGHAPQQFHCRRCEHAFRRPAWRRMPPKCPQCGATDWRV